ncbi:MAG: RND transporter [gamma proteobacterium symbiont of Taylorina sp.]|nr:RND transporter [gamma proteobacterium symbiont of Taylorina sp.]
MNFINNLSFPVLIILAILMAIAPFGAEPHLIEKWNMLMAGTLRKPLDIFDFLMHSAPFILFVIKVGMIINKAAEKSNSVE